MLQAEDLNKMGKVIISKNNMHPHQNMNQIQFVSTCSAHQQERNRTSYLQIAHFAPVSTYMLYKYGSVLFDRAFMWEYTKLATCKLLSFIATLAIVVIKGRAGLVSKILAQAIIRTSGGSDWSARIWMRCPCTFREKTVTEISNNWDLFCRLDPHITHKKYGKGGH